MKGPSRQGICNNGGSQFGLKRTEGQDPQEVLEMIKLIISMPTRSQWQDDALQL